MLMGADRILEIADEVEGSQSMAEVQAAKLRYDARRWLAGKLIGEFADRVDPPGVGAGVSISIYMPAKGNSGAPVLDGWAQELLEDGAAES
jgi:hypothetical protein